MIPEWVLILIGLGGGLIGGIILYFLSTEESKTGKQYFLSIQIMVFSIMIVVGIFSLASQSKYWLLVGSIVIGLITLILHWNYTQWWTGLLMLVFGAGYMVLFQDETIRMSIVSLLFILGLPTGTLLMVEHDNKKQKKRSR
ncbi:TPA: hypothetical protein HA241_02775 [Candidatus Woesearchaeota archaeon]|nr:hypothetical protein [Candidatus Woesearchaeota archaeon]